MESQDSSLWAGRFTPVLTLTNVFGLLGLWIAYRLGLALYNISPFHPLYRFPGPKLAAASFLYEFWFDFVKVGRYTWEIKRMHEKYGMYIACFLESQPLPPMVLGMAFHSGGDRSRREPILIS
jgi:hypothetical protein